MESADTLLSILGNLRIRWIGILSITWLFSCMKFVKRIKRNFTGYSSTASKMSPKLIIWSGRHFSTKSKSLSTHESPEDNRVSRCLQVRNSNDLLSQCPRQPHRKLDEHSYIRSIVTGLISISKAFSFQKSILKTIKMNEDVSIPKSLQGIERAIARSTEEWMKANGVWN